MAERFDVAYLLPSGASTAARCPEILAGLVGLLLATVIALPTPHAARVVSGRELGAVAGVTVVGSYFDAAIRPRPPRGVVLFVPCSFNSLNKLAKSSTSTRINFDGVVKIYGMNLQRWILPQGTLYVKTHPLMNLHGLYSASAFVIDPSNIIYRPMKNRDVKFKDNIQLPDADTRKGMWMGEVGIEVRHEKTMAYLGNFVK